MVIRPSMKALGRAIFKIELPTRRVPMSGKCSCRREITSKCIHETLELCKMYSRHLSWYDQLNMLMYDKY